MEILVTGGTGTLGRALVARLRADGYLPRVLSRRPGDDGRIVGDLETGAGLPEAVRGVDTIVHAATRFGHAALAVAEPAGRVPALAGPQIRPMADLARAWLR